jgi:hypothetical protein
MTGDRQRVGDLIFNLLDRDRFDLARQLDRRTDLKADRVRKVEHI